MWKGVQMSKQEMNDDGQCGMWAMSVGGKAMTVGWLLGRGEPRPLQGEFWQVVWTGNPLGRICLGECVYVGRGRLEGVLGVSGLK
jgi:hypothetical protein